MKNIKTTSGFECEIDENVLDDMELLDAIMELEDEEGKGNNAILSYRKIMGKLLSPELKDSLYDHLRDESGRVPTADFKAELSEIFAQIGKKK